MDRVKSLELKRVLRELEFIESDYEYRQEIVSSADKSFLDSVNEFLKDHQELKEVYDKKITEQIDNVIEKNASITASIQEEEDNNDDFESWDNEDVSDLNTRLKKLYREIVKLTHPDIVNNKKLNELYLKATEYYEADDKIKIYAICNELNIPYELSDEDIQQIIEEISKYKEKISFLENTFTWKWVHTSEEEQKVNLILEFIHLKIR